MFWPRGGATTADEAGCARLPALLTVPAGARPGPMLFAAAEGPLVPDDGQFELSLHPNKDCAAAGRRSHLGAPRIEFTVQKRLELVEFLARVVPLARGASALVHLALVRPCCQHGKLGSSRRACIVACWIVLVRPLHLLGPVVDTEPLQSPKAVCCVSVWGAATTDTARSLQNVTRATAATHITFGTLHVDNGVIASP